MDDREYHRLASRKSYWKHHERRKTASRLWWRKMVSTKKGRAQYNALQRRYRRQRWAEDSKYREACKRRSKKWHEDNRAAHAVQRAKYRKTVEYQARMLLGNAVRDGRIQKPTHCQSCSAGGRIYGHHHRGYTGKAALDVLWLCSTCHGLVHRQYPD